MISKKLTRDSDKGMLQDIQCTRGVLANPASIIDGAQQDVFSRGQVVQPAQTFKYDGTGVSRSDWPKSSEYSIECSLRLH